MCKGRFTLEDELVILKELLKIGVAPGKRVKDTRVDRSGIMDGVCRRDKRTVVKVLGPLGHVFYIPVNHVMKG